MRYWKYGVLILCCGLFGLPGCTGAESGPAQKPETPFVQSEIQKSEISFYIDRCSYEMVMKRAGDKIICTMRTMKEKNYGAKPAEGFAGMQAAADAPGKGERIFPRGCRFSVDERTLAELDALLQKGGIRADAATGEAAEIKPLRLLYVEYRNGKHIVLNRPGKNLPFRPKETETMLKAFMEKLAKDRGQELYNGQVMLGKLMQCSYSSAGSMSGGHHFVDLTRVSDTEAVYESRLKEWHNSPEKTEKRTVPATVLDEMASLGRKYRIDTWKPFPATDLIALDAATVTLTVSYGEPWSWVKWSMSMGSRDELDAGQNEYYRALRDLLMKKQSI